MTSLAAYPSSVGITAEVQHRRNEVTWWVGYLVCIGVAIMLAGLALATASQPFSAAFVVVMATALIAVVRPTLGVYLAVFLALIGDTVTSTWYPFTKNLSSRESVLYIGDQVSISPLEVVLGALVLGWVLQMLGHRRWTLERGRLMWPLLVFAGFVVIGLVNGLLRGGDLTVALWEFRPLLYLPVLYLVVINLFDRRDQYRRLYWLIMVAITINSVLALIFYRGLSALAREELESLGEHGTALVMNLIIVFIFATWLFRSRSFAARWLLPIMAVPVVWAYLIAQRRAAVVALIAALVLLGAVLRWRNKLLFWMVAPVIVLAGIGYVGAFWNSTGGAGIGAQAVKSVIAPGKLSAEDQSSDIYRQIENYDIRQTIRSSPVTGIGFGKPFLQPIPLPDTSFFVFSQYMTHNSVLWIWMKAGIGGFIAMLFLFGTTMRTGARALMNAADGEDAVITTVSMAFVLMYAVYAFVDIAWDVRAMVLLAVVMAQLDRAGRQSWADLPKVPEASVAPAPVS